MATKAAPTQKVKLPSPDNSKVQHLDPAVVMPDNKVRFSLIPTKVHEMAESIFESAKREGPGIESPVQVAALTAEEQTANPGKLYRLITGGYRHAGLMDANKRHKLGLMLPAFVIPATDLKGQILRQISENRDRADMSYMDIARAIDNMTAAGFTRQEIREAFPPTGKKEASNSWVNIVHSFLEFPADIQEMIANGEVLYEAAYALTLKPADKRATIIEDIKAKRQALIDAEAKRELAFLESEKKRVAKENKETERAKELADAEALVALSEQALKEMTEAHTQAVNLNAEAYRIWKTATGPAKAAAKTALDLTEKTFKSTQAQKESAEKVHTQNKTKLDKIKGVVTAAVQIAEQEQGEAAAPGPAPAKKGATPAKTTKQKPVTAKEVNTSAAAHGADAKAKPFSAKEMKELVQSIRLLSDPNSQKNAHMLGQLLCDAFDGKLGTFESGVDAQVQQAVVKLTGGKEKK